MMEELFWRVLNHLQSLCPKFGPSGRYRGLPRRFKRAIHAVDSTTIALVANCMDWAKHRRRKAAAKMHLRLNLQTFLPSFAIIEEASHHDSFRAMSLCAGLQAGEIAVFDKAYVHFANLFNLTQRGNFWVTRAKDNLGAIECCDLTRKPESNIISDEEITLVTPKTSKEYPQHLRRVTAWVEVNGDMVQMTFLTNNFEWAVSSICDLYRCVGELKPFSNRSSRLSKSVTFLDNLKTLFVGSFGLPCCHMRCFGSLASKAAALIASHGSSPSSVALSGIATDSLNLPTSMGQHPVI